MKAIPEGMTITGYGRAIKLFLLKGFTQDFSQGWQDFLLPPPLELFCLKSQLTP